jgi:hypothetical protein
MKVCFDAGDYPLSLDGLALTSNQAAALLNRRPPQILGQRGEVAVLEGDDFIPAGEALRQMGSDKSASAGDQNSHTFSLLHIGFRPVNSLPSPRINSVLGILL